MNHHILWHAHFKSNSIHLPTIASIIYTKPPLSSWVLRKAWSMRKCSCKVASIAARLYCIQWLQTEIAHICISCMLPNKSREYFSFCMVLSVTQVKSAQSWEKTHFKPRATHTQLHLLHFILLCVCACVRAHLCVRIRPRTSSPLMLQWEAFIARRTPDWQACWTPTHTHTRRYALANAFTHVSCTYVDEHRHTHFSPSTHSR